MRRSGAMKHQRYLLCRHSALSRPYLRRKTLIMLGKETCNTIFVDFWLPISNGSSAMCRGCSICSKDNGCLSCQPKMFLFLRREGMRQYGECLHSCPAGFYGARGPELSICSRCRLENCESCFSKDFCTKCTTGFYLLKGRCFEECPEGFSLLEESTECVEGCEVGPWSDWGACTRKNRTCGFKWGLETRTRQIVKKPPRDTMPCPTIAESRRCKMSKRHCRK
ncbi:R-spondin-2-like, partial [Scleropages formosus]